MKPWLYLAVLLTGVAIGVLFCSKCNQTKAPEGITLDSAHRLQARFDSAVEKSKSDSIAHAKYVHDNDSAREGFQQIKDDLEKKLGLKVSEWYFLKRKYDDLKAAQNTTGQLEVCDEVMQKFDSAVAQALFYKKTRDSIEANFNGRMLTDGAEIASLREQIRQRDALLSEAMKNLSQEILKNTALTSALAKTKKGRWFLAALAGIGGGFIGHSLK